MSSPRNVAAAAGMGVASAMNLRRFGIVQPCAWVCVYVRARGSTTRRRREACRGRWRQIIPAPQRPFEQTCAAFSSAPSSPVFFAASAAALRKTRKSRWMRLPGGPAALHRKVSKRRSQIDSRGSPESAEIGPCLVDSGRSRLVVDRFRPTPVCSSPDQTCPN